VHGVVPGDDQPAVVASFPIFGDLVVFFQCGQKVVCIGLLCVSYSKVIYNKKGEMDVVGSMCP